MFPTTGKGNFQEYVFGFNGQKPFVTGGHIFFTTAGPKAISPAVAREENPQVMVSQLRVGDVLYQLDDKNGKSGYAKVPIESFTVERAPCDFVYGLHFAQGSHGGARYHANGYLVAANYPEITLKRFEDRLRSLPVREQRSSVDAVSPIHYCKENI
ncbi:hypothetical protein BDV38DRAFT_266253 [Aspergillus pseudotamarii]|uniref:Uncharacterized protein n=1 Tax=Aspergillus pseudotamarii TaxID=132259 RepID=A0A5N6S802_ASPPS|nr:uncharacterized protein BDV38DRAFT_266253 [Aspergillus pseudotamarii]KAE8130796.1 hypothetical protein BDV38DRAFT_266253 [Aspergillus pseudotamarii]